MPTEDLRFMTLALELARNGEGFTSPNPMVGAVVVKDGTIVGTGFHRRVGGAHAEVNALAEAGAQASGATLYVTLEPCHHTGRTPPCTEAILAAGIRRVVMAMEDPNPAVVGGGAETLRRRGLTVDSGLCLEQARQLNEAFVTFVTTRRPFVTVKCAATLDGCIATRSGDSRWVSGPESRQLVHRLRHGVDAILVGVQTVIQDDPRLTARLPDRPGVDPLRLILDTRLSIPETAQVLHLESNADTVIVVGEGSADPGFAVRRMRIERTGVRILESPVLEGRIDLAALIRQLGTMGLTSLLIEGGAQVIGSALRTGVVDKVMFFFAPKLLAGGGIPICSGPGPTAMAEAIGLHRLTVERFADDILVQGYIKHVHRTD